LTVKITIARGSSILFFALILVSLAAAQALTTANPPEVDSRFTKVLGTDVAKIAQHYYLVKNGGVIELTAKDPNDAATVKAIQKYLDTQKELYEKGKNESEAEVHGKVPDGLPGLRKLRNEITFYSGKTDDGGVLRMFTTNEQARQAVYDFIKFQIGEHQTGDALAADQ
jgi:hypothetical protein